MDLVTDWKNIRTHFNKSFRSNFHVSIASVDANNNPTVTPIGSQMIIKLEFILKNSRQNSLIMQILIKTYVP